MPIEKGDKIFDQVRILYLVFLRSLFKKGNKKVKTKAGVKRIYTKHFARMHEYMISKNVGMVRGLQTFGVYTFIGNSSVFRNFHVVLAGHIC